MTLSTSSCFIEGETEALGGEIWQAGGRARIETQVFASVNFRAETQVGGEKTAFSQTGSLGTVLNKAGSCRPVRWHQHPAGTIRLAQAKLIVFQHG